MIGQERSRLAARSWGFLDTIRRSGERLHGIVNDIMDFSLPASGQLRLELAPTDMAAVTDRVLGRLRPAIGDRKIELVNGVSIGLPKARAEEKRVEQVLTKLVGNAIRFTEEGRVEVTAAVVTDLGDRTALASGLPGFRREFCGGDENWRPTWCPVGTSSSPRSVSSKRSQEGPEGPDVRHRPLFRCDLDRARSIAR